jgi:hypothetical protein
MQEASRLRRQKANAGTSTDGAGQPSSPIQGTTRLRRQSAYTGTGVNEAGEPLSPIRKTSRLRRPEVIWGTGVDDAVEPLSPIQETTRLSPLSVFAGTETYGARQPPFSLQEVRRRQSTYAGTYEPFSPIMAPNYAEIKPVKYLPSECLQCNNPCAAYRNFCKYSCKTMAERGAPKLIVIHSGHHMYCHSESFLSPILCTR